MIDSFDGEYRWLSNFWPCCIKDTQGNVYPTAEHAYQAMKYRDEKLRAWVREAPTPQEAVTRGCARPLQQPNWYKNRYEVMLKILRKKFSIPELKQKLLATRSEEIQYKSKTAGTYWAISVRWNPTLQEKVSTGDNMLGKALMQVRSELRKVS